MTIGQERSSNKPSSDPSGPVRPTAAASPRVQTLLASTGFLLARLGMESRRRFTRMMASHKLSTHHFGLLVALGEQGVLGQQRLCRIMGVDARNSVPIIDELERRKLIKRQPDTLDRRRCDVSLTPAGRRMMQQIHRDGATMEEEMLKSLSHEDRASLHGLLLKLFAAMGEDI